MCLANRKFAPAISSVLFYDFLFIYLFFFLDVMRLSLAAI